MPAVSADDVKNLTADWKDYSVRWNKAYEETQDAGEKQRLSSELSSTRASYATKLNLIAEKHPGDPAGREAMLDVLVECARTAESSAGWESQMRRACETVLRAYANDEKVVQAATRLLGRASRTSDRLAQGLYENARKRETKGLAALALADHFVAKAAMVETASYYETPPPTRHLTWDADGRPKILTSTRPFADPEYWKELRGGDAAALRAEADALYRMVAHDYADVPMRVGTLGQAALMALDAMHVAVPGKPAPEIVGTDLSGKPMKLSDFRGKVVFVAFFGDWAAGNKRARPVVSELAQRFADRPVVLLGVLADRDRAAPLAIMKEQPVDWRNWLDPAVGNASVRDAYHLRFLPAYAIIGADGILRNKGLIDANPLDDRIDAALKAIPAKQGEKP
jgi:thiol-disulfide isomerase/thioredoxin